MLGKGAWHQRKRAWRDTMLRLARVNTSGTLFFYNNTQVNRMSRSRRMLATGGKQRIFGLDMVCIETVLFHLDSF